MKVKEATGKDIPAIVEMLHHSFDDLPYKEFVVTDTDSLVKTLVGMFQNPLAYVFVATTDSGELVGTTGGFLVPLWFNYSHITGTALFWYVDPDHRKSRAGKLLASAIDTWAKETGASSICRAAQSNKHQKRMTNIYHSQGFVPIETTFVKEL